LLTEIIHLKNKLTCSDSMLCFQSFLGLGMSGICIQRRITGVVYSTFTNSFLFLSRCNVLKILFEHRLTFMAITTADDHGLGVALTCYISRTAKHKKMADFDPSRSQNPWTDFD